MPVLAPVSDRLERLRGRLVLFVPVFLGIGIGVYFLLRQEPGTVVWAAIMFSAGAAFGLGHWLNRTSLPGLALIPWGLAVIAAGVLIAGVRTASVAAPVLNFRYYGPVEGRIVKIDRSQSDAPRLTLDQVRLNRVAPDKLPERVRVSLHGAQGYLDPKPGQIIAVTAFLSPPEGPVEPGGFDFRRMAWFQRLGALGYARSPALLVAPPEGGLWFHRLRQSIAKRVQAQIPGEAGAFAAAITTGDRSAMGRDTIDALRGSNLAHLLAISGLHMGLMVGFVFGALRTGLALTPGVGNAVNVRKIAAVVALLTGTFYLGLSGVGVSTSRAFVMVSVVMIAVLIDRRAMTLRAVAVAAMILLVLRPETLVEAGFQMSFAATTALIAVFTALRDTERKRLPTWARPVFAVVLSSLVAGLATAPYSAAIFNRVAHYGLLANVLAVPVMGALVMPLAVVAAILAPFGLDGVALAVMRWPIEWILWIARKVAAFDGAVGHVAAPPAYVLPVFTLAALWVVLLQGRGRWLGAVVALGVLALWGQGSRPNVLISSSGRLASIIGPDGRMLSKAKGESFIAENWLANDGDGVEQAVAAARNEGVSERGRVYLATDAFSLAVLSGKTGLSLWPEVCGQVDLIVVSADTQGAAPCPAITSDMLEKTGALALYEEAQGYRLVTTTERSGTRPWTGHEKGPEASLPPDLFSNRLYLAAQ